MCLKREHCARLSARAIYPEVKPLQTWESELHGKFLYGLIIPWATGHCQSKTARPEFVLVDFKTIREIRKDVSISMLAKIFVSFSVCRFLIMTNVQRAPAVLACTMPENQMNWIPQEHFLSLTVVEFWPWLIVVLGLEKIFLDIVRNWRRRRERHGPIMVPSWSH
ncbi:hypothetical protein EV359DRAFT_63758 [Lentinula novae-zelandiae]|nr:hypothetical protein EV359DRAFT_63758 [Lentinula novae-zelandiae]